jgi:hypothetical protein
VATWCFDHQDHNSDPHVNDIGCVDGTEGVQICRIPSCQADYALPGRQPALTLEPTLLAGTINCTSPELNNGESHLSFYGQKVLLDKSVVTLTCLCCNPGAPQFPSM